MAKQKNDIVFETAFSRYRPVAVIGSGGSGRVFSVQDEEGQNYALKHLLPEVVSTAKIKRFKNELAFCSKEQHKNVIQVIDSGFVTLDDKKCPFYVMPQYGKTLRDLMKAGVPADRVLPYFSQLLDGVEAAHLKGVWHRDVKPENILYDATKDCLVVADFGIAHFEEEQLHTLIETKHGDRMANFEYAAPEQRAKGKPVDHRSDIYALGLILNEMFTGVVPHGTGFTSIAKAHPKFSYLDGLVERILNQDPAHRPASIAEIKRELIARGNAFVTEQTLSKLRKTVVPEGEIDDPLVLNPVELVDFDYNNGWLIFKLSQTVNRNWIDIFRTMGNFTSLYGKAPGNFDIVDNTAKITADESDAKQITTFFKDYLVKADADYKRWLEGVMRKKRADQEAALKKQIAEEEKRQRILKSLQA